VLKVAEGFAVQRVYSVPRESQGSWISLAADRRGMLYASDQYGPLHRIELPATQNGGVRVEPLKLPIGGVHGLTWVENELYAVVGQREISEPGLYRLRDSNRDGELDRVEHLQALDGDGEHGPHAVVAAADGQSLYVIAGNATRLPSLTRSRAGHWGNDSLLPLPALIGSETRGLAHGGWICQTDREGRQWELVCMGLRNAYGLACDRAGELFTFESDTEFEIGLPWYRPTRVLHCASGADFGWRGGALKVPEGSPDTLPALLSLGLGSPTAVLFGSGTAFPARYRDALFVADWTFGRLFAVHVRPEGAGYRAEYEEIVSGTPLPITAACVNRLDGGLYFVTGGRKTQSALYRLTWNGLEGVSENENSAPAAANPRLAQRRVLEAFHGRADDRAVDEAWPHLASDDVWLRHAARVAVESQEASTWQERALAERHPRRALAALLALARCSDASVRPRFLAALEALNWQELDELKSEWLRVSAITFSRGGPPSAEVRQRWIHLLSPQFPAADRALNGPLCEMLVYLGDPAVCAKALDQLKEQPSREQQLHYARCLSVLEAGWTEAHRDWYFDWLGAAEGWRGGASFMPFLRRIREDALTRAPQDLRAKLERRMAVAKPSTDATITGLPVGRGLVKEWKLEELVSLVDGANVLGDAEQGRKWFIATGCARCHTFAGEGGAAGSDLTSVARRLSTRDLLEAILDPSKEISDQYGTIVLRRRDGTLTSGRIVNFSGGAVHVCENLFEPSAVTRVLEGDIESITPSKVSLMPAGLLNVLHPGEILDLISYLKSSPQQP
jgi:putative heme-binding domain-containing protein